MAGHSLTLLATGDFLLHLLLMSAFLQEPPTLLHREAQFTRYEYCYGLLGLGLDHLHSVCGSGIQAVQHKIYRQHIFESTKGQQISQRSAEGQKLIVLDYTCTSLLTNGLVFLSK